MSQPTKPNQTQLLFLKKYSKNPPLDLSGEEGGGVGIYKIAHCHNIFHFIGYQYHGLSWVSVLELIKRTSTNTVMIICVKNVCLVSWCAGKVKRPQNNFIYVTQHSTQIGRYPSYRPKQEHQEEKEDISDKPHERKDGEKKEEKKGKKKKYKKVDLPQSHTSQTSSIPNRPHAPSPSPAHSAVSRSGAHPQRQLQSHRRDMHRPAAARRRRTQMPCQVSAGSAG